MQNRDMAILVTIVAVVAVSIVALSMAYDNDSDQSIDINEGLIQVTDFDMKNEIGLGSTAKGSIFFIDEGENIRVRVVADINLIPGDKGGFVLCGRECLTPTDVLCGYNNDVSNQYVECLVGEYSYVFVDRPPGGLPEGGSGTVTVEFVTNADYTGDVNSISMGVQIGYTSETYTCVL